MLRLSFVFNLSFLILNQGDIIITFIYFVSMLCASYSSYVPLNLFIGPHY